MKMSSINKKIDFTDIDESDTYDNNCGIVRNVNQIRFDLGCQQDDHEDSAMGLTSSPLSRKLLLQSPRKIKRHINFAFQTWTESESFGELNANQSESDDSPVSNRLLSVESSANNLDTSGKPNINPLTYSPPYKRVRALRLFDTPNTPKSIYEKSEAFGHHLNVDPASLEPSRLRNALFRDMIRAVPTSFQRLDKPVANVNPFSPQVLLRMRKRTRSIRSLTTSPIPKSTNTSAHSSDESMQHVEPEVEEDDFEEQPTKRMALQESNIPRYHQEFHEVDLIGEGEFGSVHKCINRLDGCFYAVKRSIRPIAGSADEARALNEVYAHAVLGSHPHVVRYYSAWAENNHMIIQNEYCNGGSLADKLRKLRAEEANPTGLPESELRRILLHISRGLHYIHQAGLVHLDIKPGNIFISHEPRVVPLQVLNSSTNDSSIEEDESEQDTDTTYKIGDLGHVTCVAQPRVEEGDCRYLPKEILSEDFQHLCKADIFSLGLSIFETAGAGPLPKNGDTWHAYRDGNLTHLPYLSPGMNELLKWMVHPVAAERPSASQVAHHPLVCPQPPPSRGLSAREAELQREINKQRLQKEILEKQLQDANRLLMSQGGAAAAVAHAAKARRLVGLRVKRSMSATNI